MNGLRLGSYHGTPIILKPSVLILAALFGFGAPALYREEFLRPLFRGRGLTNFAIESALDQVASGELVTVALLTVLGIFISILWHELGHVVAARLFGIEAAEITLWGLGGMARLKSAPHTPAAETVISAAGPFASLTLAGAFWGMALFVDPSANQLVFGSKPFSFLLEYMAFWNGLIGILNLLPGPILDGGGVVRGLVWGATGSQKTAQRASGVTGLSGAALFLGLFLSGNMPEIAGINDSFAIWAAVLMGVGSIPMLYASSLFELSRELTEIAQRGKEIATARQAATVGATDLLLAVLSYETDPVPMVLQNYGINYTEVWTQAVQLAPLDPLPLHTAPLVSEAARKTLEIAARTEHAAELATASSAPSHTLPVEQVTGRTAIFFALPEQSEADRILTSFGYSLSQLKESVAAVLRLNQTPTR